MVASEAECAPGTSSPALLAETTSHQSNLHRVQGESRKNCCRSGCRPTATLTRGFWHFISVCWLVSVQQIDFSHAGLLQPDRNNLWPVLNLLPWLQIMFNEPTENCYWNMSLFSTSKSFVASFILLFWILPCDLIVWVNHQQCCIIVGGHSSNSYKLPYGCMLVLQILK